MATHATAARVSDRTVSVQRLLARAAARGPGEPIRLAILSLCALALLPAFLTWPTEVPRSIFAPLVVFAGLGLGMRRLRIFYVVVALCILVTIIAVPTNPWRAMSVLAIMGSTMIAMYVLVRAREGLGLYGTSGERLLAGLRQAHGHFGEIPALPEGWRVECAVAGAHGDTFLGDVVLCADGFHDHHAEICLIDVSGKGLRAGTRGMTVAAAFSGLLGQVEPWRFLEAANSYLVRQEWAEGFATAVHVDLDPVFGRFSVSGAGHPPAMHYCGQTGSWAEVSGVHGPALGLMDGMSFPRSNAEMRPGDALVLFTDGVIESRDGELADGIDWVGGLAESYVPSGSFEGLAQSLIDAARGGTSDDRAAVVIWRS